jgi:hypothetical protein
MFGAVAIYLSDSKTENNRITTVVAIQKLVYLS